MIVETSLYLRVRGRALGPYNQEKLQSLVKRGQLSRLHELSADGINWVRATTYPELFVSSEAPIPEMSISAKPGPVASMPSAAPLASPPTPAVSWHYMRADSQTSQADQWLLEQMIASGKIDGDTLVWTEGMPTWTPARQIAALSAAFSAAAFATAGSHHHAGGATTDNDLSRALCEAALSSRGWVLFLAIAGFVWAGFGAVSGVYLLFTGAAANAPPLVTSGMIQLVAAIVGVIGPFLLLGYTNRLASLRHSPKPIVLAKALESLRAYWVYLGVLVIVGIVAIVLVIVLIFAGTLAFLTQLPTHH